MTHLINFNYIESCYILLFIQGEGEREGESFD